MKMKEKTFTGILEYIAESLMFKDDIGILKRMTLYM